MKHVLILLAVVVSLTATVLAQTELWRCPGIPRWIQADGHGNVYFLRNLSSSGLDTLFKVNASGTTVWSVPMNGVGPVLYLCSSGPYVDVAYDNGSHIDTVYYYDTLGTLIWRFAFPSPHDYPGLIGYVSTRIDASGDFIYPITYRTPDYSYKLIKLSKTGTVAFEKDLLSLMQKERSKYAELEFLDPLFDGTGKIWVRAVQKTHTDVTDQKGVERECLKGRVFALFLDGATGNLISKTKLAEGLFEKATHYPDGRYEMTSNGDLPFSTSCLTAGSKLILWGSNTSMSYKINRRGFWSSKTSNEWRVQTVDPQGKVSLFKFKGNGLYKRTNVGGTQTDNGDGNILYHASIADNNTLYLDGDITWGKDFDGSTPLHYDYVIIKFDPSANKAVWTKVVHDKELYSNILYHRGEHRMMIVAEGDDRRITVMDQNGDTSLTPLWIPDGTWGLAELYPPTSMTNANMEAGILYTYVHDPGTVWAKFALPPLSFGLVASTRSEVEDQLDENETYQLAQNYPNPFNPTTTISFILPEDALVTLKIYNSLGQEVATLAEREEFMEGDNELEFDASKLPSGVYFYRLIAEGIANDQGTKEQVFTSSRKMLLLK